jgi:hypothetical protein
VSHNVGTRLPTFAHVDAGLLGVRLCGTVTDDANRPTDMGTLTVLYDETRHTLDRQMDLVDGLNGRAQQLLGFAAVIVSVIAAIGGKEQSDWVRALVLFDLSLFAVVAGLCFAAWRFKTYRDDPDVVRLYTKYRYADEAKIRDQVIGNRFDAIDHNAKIIGWKESRIRDASWVLVGAFIVLAALVITKLFV